MQEDVFLNNGFKSYLKNINSKLLCHEKSVCVCVCVKPIAPYINGETLEVFLIASESEKAHLLQLLFNIL